MPDTINNKTNKVVPHHLCFHFNEFLVRLLIYINIDIPYIWVYV